MATNSKDLTGRVDGYLTINFMKHAMSLDRSVEWCCLVADHVREKG
jgi:hypothetical protein